MSWDQPSPDELLESERTFNRATVLVSSYVYPTEITFISYDTEPYEHVGERSMHTRRWALATESGRQGGIVWIRFDEST